MGQLVHTLPEGPTVNGVTSLADEIYLLRRKEREQVEVYDITYRLQRCRCRTFVLCVHFSCVYIGDYDVEYVHRLDVQGAATRWAVNDKPACLSVNAARNVIVTRPDVRNIKAFSSHVI